MSEMDELIAGVTGKARLLEARQAAKELTVAFKRVGADLEEAICLLEEMPLNVPLAQLWVERYWDEVTT